MADQNVTAIERLSELERERARLAGGAEHAANTKNGYQHDQKLFRRFCAEVGLAALPAEPNTLALYVTHLLTTGRKVRTAARYCSAVAWMHREAGLPSPATAEIRLLLRGARRLKIEGVRKVKPLTLDHLRAIVAALAAADTPLAVRDRAVVLVGITSALRSANLASLRLEDAEFCVEGVRLTIHRSKTDQEGRRRALIGIPHGKHPQTCAVKALAAWLARRGGSPGPLFTRFDGKQPQLPLQPERFCQIVQGAVERIGLDAKCFGSHSLRATFCTMARNAKVPDWQIAQTTGHRDPRMLAEYWRPESVWESNALSLMDL